METLRRVSASPEPATTVSVNRPLMAAAMVATQQLGVEGWAVGTSKLFMKAGEQQQLEIARETYLRRVVAGQVCRWLSIPPPRPTALLCPAAALATPRCR